MQERYVIIIAYTLMCHIC